MGLVLPKFHDQYNNFFKTVWPTAGNAMRLIVGESCPCLHSELAFSLCQYRIIASHGSGVPIEE
eukprot:5163117-Ditylum_brightwellii.AAC.1